MHGTDGCKLTFVLASLLPGFRNVRNSAAVGAISLVAMYLLLAPRWSGFTAPGSVSSQPLKALAKLLGPTATLAAIGLIAILVGETVCSLATKCTRSICRRVLTYSLSDFDDEMELSQRLANRNAFARTFAAFSSNSLRRMYGRLCTDPLYQSMDQKTRCILFRSLMQQMIFMSPRLIALKPESFAEEQRLRADSELRDGLLVSLPIALCALTIQFDSRPLWLSITIMLLIPSIALYLLWDGRHLWREANSQVAHGICDGNVPLEELLQRAAADLSGRKAKTLPRWLAAIHDRSR